MFEYTFNMTLTLALGILLLLLGRYIKSKVSVLQKYFIPAPVIGGLIFSTVLLIGYSTGTFMFTFDNSLKDLLMVAFFTTIGFLASAKMLAKGGIQVIIFLAVASVLIAIQNTVGIAIAELFGINPLIGIAAGSVPLTGGHGTSGAFGPVLEEAGAVGATTVAIAAATFGLVAGCMIGGPVARRLMIKNNLKFTGDGLVSNNVEDKKTFRELSEEKVFKALVLIIISMGIGSIIINFLRGINIPLPVYIGPMLIAALFRNILDGMNKEVPSEEISIIGNISLAVFLSIALMTMRLWELASLAVPLIVILLTQTIIVALYVYFITFKIMGKDYDAVVMCAGHCGFGLGATPNAMANMETFTTANGPSPRAFLVVPLVAAFFIDLTNSVIITAFIGLVDKFL